MLWMTVGAAVYLCVAWLVLVCWQPSMFHVKRPVVAGMAALNIGAAGAVIARHGCDLRHEVVAMIALVPILAALSIVDLQQRRLPNRLTLAAAGGACIGVGGLSLMDSDLAGQRLVRLLLAVLLSAGVYGALTFGSGGRGMGLGDFKLAPSLAALPAWLGWEQWLTCLVVPFVAGGLWGSVLLVRGKGKGAVMPFGPLMIAGWYVALLGA